MKVILTIEDNSFQIISLRSMLHLVYRENFLLTCAMKISVANLLQFVALMLKNDNSIDAEKT